MNTIFDNLLDRITPQRHDEKGAHKPREAARGAQDMLICQRKRSRFQQRLRRLPGATPASSAR
eukprot:3806761-Pyramimonas_sp.AAC.1